MVNELLPLNSDEAINKLRSVFFESKGTVLDEVLLKKVDSLCQSLENDLKKRDFGSSEVLKGTETDRKMKSFWDYNTRDRRQNDNIMDVIEAGLCLLDKDLKIIWANKTLSDWLDLKESPVGSSCKEVFHCNQADMGNCEALKVFKGGEGRVLQTWITSKRGKRICVQRIAIPISSRNGEIENVLVHLEDVTRSENYLHWLLLLQQLGEKMQGTLHLEKLLQLILTCVTTGHAFGFNRAMLFLINKEENILQGKLAVGPSNPEEANRIWNEISSKYGTLEEILDAIDYGNDSDNTLSTLTREMKFLLTDTREIVVSCAREKNSIIVVDAAHDPRLSENFRNALGTKEFVCVPLIIRNESMGVIVADNIYTGTPITEDLVNVLSMFANQAALAIENAETYKKLKNKVKQLTRTQELLVRSEKFAAIGSMASYIAHEIRNPLVTIGGFTRSLSRFRFEDPKIKTNLDIILAEVTRLEKILNNITNYSKPSIPKKAPIQICEIVENTCALMENYFKERNINFCGDYPRNLPPIMAVSSQITQVLFNILMNAVEAMSHGGDLTIKIALVEESLKIDIVDTGTGMTKEESKNIFDPFYTTKTDGTGVGLAICRKIIDEHRGKICVKSEYGKGTTMSLLLPIH